VNISYNLLPKAPDIFAAEEYIWRNNSKPVFNWNFNDVDGYQSGFQIYFDDDVHFDNIDYNSGIQNSTNQTWQFGEGTNFNTLKDGIWYWKIRTRDNHNDWGKFSDSSILKIDTEPPRDLTIVPDNNNWISNRNPVIRFSATDSGSGPGHFEVIIDNMRFKSQTTSYTLPSLDDGKHIVSVTAYDRAGNYCEETIEVFIDATYPAIRKEHLYKVKRLENITINLTVTDEHSGVGNVLLFFKNNATKIYSTISMEKINDTYSAIIPSDVVTSTISYYFMVSDRSIPSNEIYIHYWGYYTVREFTPMTIYVPLPIKSVQTEEPDVPELIFNNPDKDNIDKETEEKDKTPLMEKYDNYSPLIFIIIITIFISILWIKVVGADNLLLNPYSRTRRDPHRLSNQFSQTLFIYYGEMIKPEHNDKLPPDLLKGFKANKMPPQPAEIIDRSYLIMYKKTFVKIKCPTCNKSYKGEYTRTFGSSRCPFCKKYKFKVRSKKKV
jgi:hypothetical protein